MVDDYMENNDVVMDFPVNETHVWVIDLVNKPFMVNKMILSKDELERAEKFLLNNPKETYLICRYALRCILAYYLNIEPNEIVFEYNQYGKPYLKAKKYRYTLQFNLSHCQNIGCIAISKSGEIGLDVEQISFPLTEMTHTFMAEEEINLLNLFQGNKNFILYHLWVQKEAVLKAKGTGLQILPTDIQGFITPKANLRNELIDLFYINTFHYHQNVLAVCTTTEVDVKFFEFEKLR